MPHMRAADQHHRIGAAVRARRRAQQALADAASRAGTPSISAVEGSGAEPAGT
jgi:Tfp pilus assembly protein PilX